ncbi:hypothetical protein [Amycolatopsis sp. NBC_01286]|uniref:hypothetical protein n=1 Tax=Amycolatopsis sp. NBC_01286 TaxID=2903560 RepID=UPI002E14C0F3|nr:hypothetical protein OG570_40415 [Amycolatopsis sp. NBC_01286]
MTVSDEVTQEPLGERYGLVEVRDLGEYAEALTRLLERGRRERPRRSPAGSTVVSAPEHLTRADHTDKEFVTAAERCHRHPAGAEHPLST